MFYAHALMSEHAKYTLLFYNDAYGLEWTDHAHWRVSCVHAHYDMLTPLSWNKAISHII